MHSDAKQQGLAAWTMKAKKWLNAQPQGEFTAWVFGSELGLNAFPEVRDTVLSDMVTMNLIEPFGDVRGRYRPVKRDCRPMDWHNAITDYYPIWLPLEIHRICGVQKKNVVVVAGETNAGKTALVVETIHKNLKQNGGSHERINLFNSEMGDGELRARLLNMDNNPSNWAGLEAFERTRDFHQVIDPDGFNVIDYLEISDKFYLVGKMIQQIHEKLNNGIAIVCIQKSKGLDFARGGEFGLEKSRLAISLFYNHGMHSCKIVKCKLPLGQINPQGMERDFIVEHGRNIRWSSDWRYLTEKERADLWKQHEQSAAANKTRAALGL
ncbi:protein of unknown function [Pseudodesulfovibrio profundus]|uniref:Uncharacterized protein n=1 Tax=Pseudodesulfovibrio profundus TaxID=57320 RepID=A0A2C8FFF6_9BACT|nr:DnaB-like helicase C-terminal domain-containing protein [Pseudodesulfovibrio profundus]SOB60618.1 protein of unknown function [Pseudodesulfovibrio profundus]